MQWYGKVTLGDAMQWYGIVECRGATLMWGQAKCSFGIVIYRLAMEVQSLIGLIFYIVIPVKQWYSEVTLRNGLVKWGDVT